MKGHRMKSMNSEIFSVGPLHADMIGYLPFGSWVVGTWLVVK